MYTLPSECSEEEQLIPRHSALLKAYRRQDWAGARAAIGECRRRDARLAQLYDLYAERIDFYAANPPGPDWEGVFVATEK